MARPRAEQPTPGELEVLKVLWDLARPATVREVLDALNARAEKPRAYTSAMSLLNVMTDKGLLRRSPQGRAFVYEPEADRDPTQRSLLGETLRRAYEGSASLLVAHLLDQSSPSTEELDEIRALLDQYASRPPSAESEGGEACPTSRPRRRKP